MIRTIFRPARKQSIFRTERAGSSAVPRVFGGLVVCLAVAGLLSSQRLVDMADRKEFGPERDRWLAAADTFHGVAAEIGLDRPASAIDAVLGRGDGPREVVLGELAPTGARGTTVAAPPVTRLAEDDSAADDSGLPSTSTSTTETSEAVTASS